MGGKGSGAWRGKPALETLEGMLELNIPFLRAAGMKKGARGSIPYSHAPAGFHADIDFNLLTDDAWLRLRHLTRHERKSEREVIQYDIKVSWSKTNLGNGIRYWLHCPADPRRRVTQLILPLGRSRFMSRQAYGFPYQTERMTKEARLIKKAKRLHKRAGGAGNWRIPPKIRPKGMHKATWKRLLSARAAAVTEARGFRRRHKTALRRAAHKRRQARV